MFTGRLSGGERFRDTVRNFYTEDIYVGYRYFETFCPEKVMYEFGFGLSYSKFDIEILKAETITEESEVGGAWGSHGYRLIMEHVQEKKCRLPSV